MTFAGDVAIDLLEIIKLTGKNPMVYKSLYENGMECICTDLLYQYLTTTEQQDCYHHTKDVRVCTTRFAMFINHKEIIQKTASINDVSCKIMTHLTGNLVGSIIKISSSQQIPSITFVILSVAI